MISKSKANAIMFFLVCLEAIEAVDICIYFNAGPTFKLCMQTVTLKIENFNFDAICSNRVIDYHHSLFCTFKFWGSDIMALWYMTTRETHLLYWSGTCARDFSCVRPVSSSSLTYQLSFINCGLNYAGQTRSSLWPVMLWFLASPGHQQDWYWSEIGMFEASLRVTVKDMMKDMK